MGNYNRRTFIRSSVLGGAALAWFPALAGYTSPVNHKSGGPVVALTSGEHRADLAFRALQPFAKQVKQAIGNRRVILKPNNVLIDHPLCATQVDTLEGILEFLKSINKLGNVVIAESAANGSTLEGFGNYGYFRLLSRYPVKLVDLDREPYEILYVFDEKDFRPHAVRMSKLLLDQDSYIVSVARMKTHDRVVATLSLKNIVFGAPVKDQGFTWGPKRAPGSRSDKSIAHGSGFRAINYNICTLARQLHPHLAVIDGFEGMEGDGPNYGTPVDHRICVASPDWFSADRVAVELMGIDFAKVGYLNFCAQTGLGTNLDQINIIGEKISDHIKKYQLNKNMDAQLVWMHPAG